jgi:hypothetical protein
VFIIKRIITLVMVLLIMATVSPLAYAKSRGREEGYQSKHHSMKRDSISLQRGLRAIKPKSTTSAAIALDPQITAQAVIVKQANDNYNNITEQIFTKRSNTIKLIMNIRRSRQTLSDDQYTNINNLIDTINTEANAIVNVDGINNAIMLANGKNTARLETVTLQDLTSMLDSINANTTHLNSISTTFDTVNSTLTDIVNTISSSSTTTSAITLQPSVSD